MDERKGSDKVTINPQAQNMEQLNRSIHTNACTVPVKNISRGIYIIMVTLTKVHVVLTLVVCMLVVCMSVHIITPSLIPELRRRDDLSDYDSAGRIILAIYLRLPGPLR